MPHVSYFANRVRTKTFTASDATELFAASTFTTGLKYPPHPHAHVAKDGFHVGPPLNKQEQQALQKFNDFGVSKQDKATYVDLRNRATYEAEGLHLDPATRDAYYNYEANDYRVIDPVKGRYIDRALHSQFPDNELAVLALYHTLNSPAGQKALDFLEKHDGGRASIYSISAANALRQKPLPLNNPPKVLSPHPERDTVPELVERSKGASGKATLTPAPFTTIETVLDNRGGELCLTTHYPTQKREKFYPIKGNEANLLEMEEVNKAIAWNDVLIGTIRILVKSKQLIKAIGGKNKFQGKMHLKVQALQAIVNGKKYRKAYTMNDDGSCAQEITSDIDNENKTVWGPKFVDMSEKNMIAANHDYVDARLVVNKITVVNVLYKTDLVFWFKVPPKAPFQSLSLLHGIAAAGVIVQTPNKPADVTWANKEPKILGLAVRSSGQACVVCGVEHFATPSIFRSWYQCEKCGSCYCPTDSATLAAGPPLERFSAFQLSLSGGKKCTAPRCAGIARPIY